MAAADLSKAAAAAAPGRGSSEGGGQTMGEGGWGVRQRLRHSARAVMQKACNAKCQDARIVTRTLHSGTL